MKIKLAKIKTKRHHFVRGLIPCLSEIVLNAVIPWPDREDMETCLGQNSKNYTGVKTT